MSLNQGGESLIDYMANRMMIVLSSPEEFILKEGDTLESNYITLPTNIKF